MSYDKKGLGFAELTEVALYFPSIFTEIEKLLEVDATQALQIAQRTVDAYNAGMIDKEV